MICYIQTKNYLNNYDIQSLLALAKTVYYV